MKLKHHHDCHQSCSGAATLVGSRLAAAALVVNQHLPLTPRLASHSELAHLGEELLQVS